MLCLAYAFFKPVERIILRTLGIKTIWNQKAEALECVHQVILLSNCQVSTEKQSKVYKDLLNVGRRLDLLI